VRLFVVPLALAELHDAASFYTESANAKLGEAFVAEFEWAASLILENPEIGARFRRRWRRFTIRRFPYSVFYQIVGDEIRVLAIAHQRRRPSYWRSASRP
jgi:toxin ParE1/3/4